MRALAFDTETTGVTTDTINKFNPANDVPVQLAALLFDMDMIGSTWKLGRTIPQGALISVLDFVKPSAPRALEVHKIDKPRQDYLGISTAEALAVFAEFLDNADVLVGHNVKYDMDILSIAYAHAGWEGDPFKDRVVFDTCDQSLPICKLPKQYMKHPEDWKKPKLIEAYKHFFKRGFDGAHGAYQDTQAAFDLYLMLLGKTPIMEPTVLEKVDEALSASNNL